MIANPGFEGQNIEFDLLPPTKMPASVPKVSRPHFVVNEALIDPYNVRKSLYSPGQTRIAEVIRLMRCDTKLTQRDLAARLNRPLNVVSRIESGQRRVDLLEWIALCEACKADPVESGRALLQALTSRDGPK